MFVAIACDPLAPACRTEFNVAFVDVHFPNSDSAVRAGVFSDIHFSSPFKVIVESADFEAVSGAFNQAKILGYSCFNAFNC